MDVLRERLRQLETVSRVDFSANFTYLDPQEEKRREEKERELASLGHRSVHSGEGDCHRFYDYFSDVSDVRPFARP